MSRGKRPAASGQRPARAERFYLAGCGRSWTMPGDLPDYAYTDQAFPECPTCPHRVEPEGGPPFCTLRPKEALNPFAVLGGLELPD